MTIGALSTGHSCSAQGPGACFVFNIALTYEESPLPNGTGKGLLSICPAKDVSAKPEAATCVVLPDVSSYDNRRDEYIDLPVQYTVTSGKIEITQYAGMPGDPNGENKLLVYHPAIAFAAPGACNVDLGSPLVLDLDSSGDLALTDVWGVDPPVYFDLEATGQKVRTAWVKPGDGLLVLPSNGHVNDGRELFGEYSRSTNTPAQKGRTFADGFAALRQYDTNRDGKIDAKDPVFKKLMVWRDLNQNGLAETNELKSIEATGIVAIALDAAPVERTSRVHQDGNAISAASYFITRDGAKHMIADVWFKQRRGPEIVRTKSTSPLAKVKP